MEFPIDFARKFCERKRLPEDCVSESYLQWRDWPVEKQTIPYLTLRLKSIAVSLLRKEQGGRKRKFDVLPDTSTGTASVNDETGEYVTPDSTDKIMGDKGGQFTKEEKLQARRRRRKDYGAIVCRIPKQYRPLFRDFARGMEHAQVAKKHGIESAELSRIKELVQTVLLPKSGKTAKRQTAVIVPQVVTMRAEYGGRIVAQFTGMVNDAEQWFNANRQSGAQFYLGEQRIA